MKRLLITFLAPFVVASSLNAAVDMFLQLDGIKGESKDTKYPETIEIESFSWGASNTGASGGGGGAGKVIMQDVHFVAKVSKASPQLLLACAEGKHIPKAVLYGRKAGDDGRTQDYLTITLEDVFITSVSQTGRTPTSAGGDSRPTEEVAFYYNRIAFRYLADDGTETIGSAVRTPTPAQ